jgi:hypothetical protein
VFGILARLGYQMKSRSSLSRLPERIDSVGEVRDREILYFSVKVLTTEKRGGVRIVSYGRSPFKVFSMKFSNKSVHCVQAPSYERPKTTQQTLFLLFANNNSFPITLLCRAAAHFLHRKLN